MEFIPQLVTILVAAVITNVVALPTLGGSEIDIPRRNPDQHGPLLVSNRHN